MALSNPMSARDAHENLELATDTPNIRRMMAQIEQAQNGRMSWFLQRNARAQRWWQSRWDGQFHDGRRHADELGDAFPWEGASDSRIRTVKQVVRDHVMIAKAAFNGSKVQASTIRPLAPGAGRRSNHVTSLLKWQVNTQQRAELQRELPLALAWRFGYGACLLGCEWEQSRRLEYHDLTIPTLADLLALREQLEDEQKEQLFMQLSAAFGDPTQEEPLIVLLQGLLVDQDQQPVLSRAESRRIVSDLAQLRTASVPVPYVFASKPTWTALKIGVDVVFMDVTGDLQQEPWIARFERVSETTLRDRIKTEDYEKDFVEEAVQHKGRSHELQRLTSSERQAYGGADYPLDADADEHGIDLVHFLCRASKRGVPCLYRTIFAPAALRRDQRHDDEKPLYAKHGLHEYKHGEYPLIPLRFEKEDRPITDSQGIAEYAYTWEMEIKQQADGMSDRTVLVNRPPMIVPYHRVSSIQGTPIPGAVLGVNRPTEIQWMPLPQSDGTPVQVINQVMERVNEFFGIFGANVDPDKKQLRRQEIADDTLGELCLVLKQQYQLDLQYMDDEEVAAIVGPLETPWQQSRQGIQELHEITATFNARMLDLEYASGQLDLFQKMMAFNQGGTANTNRIFRAAAELVAPELADEIVDDDQVATDRERKDEKQAIVEMLNGMEPDKPQFANHNLRLQVLQEVIQTPGMMARLVQNPETMALFQNRMEFHQNQIQQYQKNPQIGRTLTTKTFDKTTAPQMTLAGG